MTFERCTGCGRCGQWLLLRNGKVLASGTEAQLNVLSHRMDALTRDVTAMAAGLAELNGVAKRDCHNNGCQWRMVNDAAD